MKVKDLLEGETGTRKVLFNIARSVRRWAEKYIVNNYDFDEDLSGMCGIAAGELWKRLKASGIKAEIYQREDWGSHCWVEAEGYLIDVTGSQFGYPKIILRKINNVPSAYQWLQKNKNKKDVIGNYELPVTHKYRTAAQLRKHQNKQGWPGAQIALK